jgi:hypothetical protein
MSRETGADRVMRRLNPGAVGSRSGGEVVFIEDVRDSEEDSRWYRIEYKSNLAGTRAIAICLSNPWNRSDVTAGTEASRGHVYSGGELCLGSGLHRVVSTSRYTLEQAVLRARYWATAFSVLKETGSFPNP